MITIAKNNIENSENRNSDVPGTEYTIRYRIGDHVRDITIRAQSPFLAFKKFKLFHPETFKHCAVEKLDNEPDVIVEEKPLSKTIENKIIRWPSIWQPPLPSVMSLITQEHELPEGWTRAKW